MPNTYTLIASTTVGSGGASSLSFSSIPQTFTDLKIVISSRVNYAGDWVGILGQFNGSSTGYSYVRLFAYDSSTITSDTSAAFGMSQGTNSTSNTFATSELYLPNYTTSSNKTFIVNAITEANSTAVLQLLSTGVWANSSAVTSISLTSDVSQNFVQNTTAVLYGIKKS